MSYFYTPWENLWFSDVFREYRNGTLAWKGLIYTRSNSWGQIKTKEVIKRYLNHFYAIANVSTETKIFKGVLLFSTYDIWSVCSIFLKFLERLEGTRKYCKTRCLVKSHCLGSIEVSFEYENFILFKYPVLF